MALKFDSYICRVHKQIHPHLSLSNESKSKLNELINALVKDFVRYLVVFTEHCRKNTISSREVQNAVRLIFYGDLGKKAVGQGVRAVTKYTSFYQKNKKKTTTAHKAGLVLPPNRIRTIIKANVDDYKTDLRVSETSSVYLAGVVEYVMEEILELSGKVAIHNKKKKITVDDVRTAIQNDIELKKTLYCSLEKPLHQ